MLSIRCGGRWAGARSAKRSLIQTSSRAATQHLGCAATPPPEIRPPFSSTAGTVQDGPRGRPRMRGPMLEPYAGKPARTVLRGRGGPQGLPGYPTLAANILFALFASTLVGQACDRVGRRFTFEPRHHPLVHWSRHLIPTCSAKAQGNRATRALEQESLSASMH